MTARGDYIDRLGVTQPPMMQDTNALETFVFVSPLDALTHEGLEPHVLCLAAIILLISAKCVSPAWVDDVIAWLDYSAPILS